jgi:glycosyltransferase involved in cell wall biosynthesis
MRVVAIACDLCPPIKVRVLGAGSVSGVDLRRFSPARAPAAFREEVRRQFGIPADATVITFVGRIVRDKGIVELAAAWSQLRCQFPGLWLLICGAAESEDPVPQVTLNTLHSDPRVRCTGAFVQDVFPVFAATDICVLPSYREGLGNVVLESAAMGIPTVATRIPGCIDAVVDGVTGLLVEPRCPEALAAAIAKLAADTALRQKLGDAARRRVERAFSQVQVSEAILSEYKRLLGERGSSVQEKVWHAEA